MVIHSQSLYLVSIQMLIVKKKGGGERSDSIMILSINPKTKKTEIVSIPRDTRAEIVGRGTTEKIAHAYAYGGPNMAVKSLEKLMNVPIDHYATSRYGWFA